MHENKHIFTPGPVKMPEDIIALGGQQTPYFRNQAFSDIVRECEQLLLQLVNAPKYSRVIFLTGSGTAAMEATVLNLLSRAQKTIMINGGGFGQRFVDIAQSWQFPVYNHTPQHPNLAKTQELEPYADANALCINGHETSIGLLYDLTAVGQFCRKHKLLHIVDAISLFVTDPLDMQQQAIDVVLLGSQKGLALPPGMAFIVLSPQAIARIQATKSYYFNFQNYLDDGKRGQTPFTPAVSIILQLHARLRQIYRHGIQEMQQQAGRLATYFRQAIQALPLVPYTDYMPNAMTALRTTDGKSALQIVRDLDERYNMIVTPNGGALAQQVFRVSHMGSLTQSDMDLLINALFDYYGKKR